MIQPSPHGSDFDYELRFYIPLDTKQVILETFFLSHRLASTKETKTNTTKASIHMEHKILQGKKLKPGLVTSYTCSVEMEQAVFYSSRANVGHMAVSRLCI